MEKVLLTTLNSKYIHSSLALRCLYSAARENVENPEWRCDIKEFTINQDDDYILSEILYGDYQAVCFSVNIWNVERTQGIISVLKQADPEMRILVGGPEVTSDPLDFLRNNPGVDFAADGEGEYIFTALCDLGFQGAGYHQIPGLIYRERKDKKIYVNQPQPPIKIDSLPFPYKHLPPETEKLVYYESSRGCPYRCSYCLSSIEKGVRSLPEDRVKEEMDYFLRMRVSQVKLVDRTFNWDRERCYRLIQHVIDNDNLITGWHFEVGGHLLDSSLLGLLKKARPGQIQFEVGIQSTHSKTLEAVGRSADIESVLENTTQLIQLGNCHVHVDLIAGLPYEDYDTFRTSFNDVYALKAHHFQLGFLKLLKGTSLRREATEHDMVYQEKAPYQIIRNRYLSVKDLLRLKQIEQVLNLYYNRGGFSQTLDYMIQQVGNSFDFFEEFALFYHLKGYQGVSHKKEDLYRILKKYSSWKNRTLPGTEERATELLTMDMQDTLNEDAIKKFNRKGWNI
jgi:radical SAM superfamily enzyme YgiQ (UPF0313 family)